MLISRTQVDAASERYRSRRIVRDRNKRLIKEGHPLAVDTPKRVKMFLDRRGLSLSADGVNLRETANALGTEFSQLPAGAALERVLGRSDLLGVAFLEQGLRVAKTVARVWVGVTAGQAEGFGTGFMVSPSLFMTNNHVFPDAGTARVSLVEFDYAISASGQPKRSSVFSVLPDVFFETNSDLDYTLVAVARSTNEGRPLEEFGWNPLVEEEGKAIGGQYANIIQHPGGQYKQLAFRQNLIVDVLEDFLHYESDTAQGSSGSPVYNDRWEVIALHHSGVWDKNAAGEILATDGSLWRPEMGEENIKWTANEGARVSRIVKDLKARFLDPTRRKLLGELTSSHPVDWNAEEPERDDRAEIRSDRGSVSVGGDGTATWTIPISVTLSVGGPISSGAPLTPGAIAATSGPGGTRRQSKGDDAQSGVAAAQPPEAIVAAARAELGTRSDVLGVRLGWVFKSGWITDERAIVVTVPRKMTPSELGAARIGSLPDSYRGLPVEVVEPTILETLRMSPSGTSAEELVKNTEILATEITYEKPVGVSLAPVRGKMRIVAHVSPDAGWSQLHAFLGRVRRDLFVGMYDFGAEHIATALGDLGEVPSFKEMDLVMQFGESTGTGTKKDDWTDDQTVDFLREKLGERFKNAWVRIGDVNGWVARSYHIKVAVRDGEEVWLSSGNWQSSNQPPSDPLTENPQSRTWLDHYNREWHLVVSNEKLAKTFGKMLMHDFKANESFHPGKELLPEIFLPQEEVFSSAQERARAFSYFPPFDEDRLFNVEPLLTPDNFHERVLAFIEEAEDELLIQNQTFNAPTSSQPKLAALIDAVLERKRRGVGVKIVFRILKSSDARKNLEALKDYGFDPADIKVQKNCHTKGVIVDRKAVLVGSQNWSNLGVSTNRDASLLVRDPNLARYFANIFDHDWSNLAKQDIRQNMAPVEIASAGSTPRAGYVTLDWKDWAETL